MLNTVSKTSGKLTSRDDFFSSLLVGTARFWDHPILRSVKIRVLLWVTVFGYCAARAVVGLVGTRLFSHDAFWLLSGCWRALNGQRVGKDFSDVVGFLAYLPASVGLLISHGTIWGFGIGQALAAAFLSLWMYLLARDRLADVPRILMVLAVCFTAAAPYALGFSPFQLSPGMTYNHYGNCLLALLLVEATALRKSGKHVEFWGGLSTGVIIGGLFFFKVTHFILGVCLVVALLPYRKRSRANFSGLLVGFIGMLLPCLMYYRFDISPIFGDLKMLSKARHIQLVDYVIDQTLGEAAVLIVFCLGAAAFARTHATKQAGMRILIIGFVATFFAIVTLLGNYEFAGLAMAPFIAILVADLLLGSAPGTCDELFKGTLLLLGSAVASTVFFAGLFSMSFAGYERFYATRHIPHMHGSRLAGFATDGVDFQYANFVNDGLDLLNRLRHPGETVMCLDFSDIYSYALGSKPAPGGAVGLKYKSSFNDRHYIPPAFLFGQADLVIVPKVFSDGSLQESVPRIYGPYLNAHFREIGASRDWVLYRRDTLTTFPNQKLADASH